MSHRDYNDEAYQHAREVAAQLQDRLGVSVYAESNGRWLEVNVLDVERKLGDVQPLHPETKEAWESQRGEILDLLRGLANTGKPHFESSWDHGAALRRLEEWRVRATAVLGRVDT
jgi:hypothetical protein